MLLNKLPPDALLLIFVFAGATIRAVSQQGINPWHGLKTAFGSALTGFMAVAAVCDFGGWQIGMWQACTGGLIAYLGSYVLASIDIYGQKALSRPDLLTEFMPPILKKLFTVQSDKTPPAQ